MSRCSHSMNGLCLVAVVFHHSLTRTRSVNLHRECLTLDRLLMYCWPALVAFAVSWFAYQVCYYQRYLLRDSNAFHAVLMDLSNFREILVEMLLYMIAIFPSTSYLINCPKKNVRFYYLACSMKIGFHSRSLNKTYLTWPLSNGYVRCLGHVGRSLWERRALR